MNIASNLYTWKGGFQKGMNTGDWKSSPSHYFYLLDFDVENLYDKQRSDQFDHLIIGGGGLWHPDMLSSIDHWLLRSLGKKIAWGIGHNFHGKIATDYSYIDRFDLFGCRDWRQVRQIENAYWVPCASCMDPAFDRIPTPPESEFGVVSHHQLDISPNFGFPSIHNNKPFEEIVDFIYRHDCILTNTYHGMYWSILAGRRVVVIDPFSTRFLYSRFRPEFATEINWLERSKLAKHYPGALSVCRKANVDFYEKVKTCIGG